MTLGTPSPPISRAAVNIDARTKSENLIVLYLLFRISIGNLSQGWQGTPVLINQLREASLPGACLWPEQVLHDNGMFALRGIYQHDRISLQCARETGRVIVLFFVPNEVILKLHDPGRIGIPVGEPDIIEYHR